MNKTNTSESTLNMIKSVCAERDRKERDRLRANRLAMEQKEEAERERIQHSNSILNSYIEKVQARENQHSQEYNQMMQNIHDESMRRRSEDAYRTQEMTDAINRGIQNAREIESRNTEDAFMDRNKRLLDKGRERIKRQQNKTYSVSKKRPRRRLAVKCCVTFINLTGGRTLCQE